MSLSNVKNVFIVNLWGKNHTGYSKGQLNKSFCDSAEDFFRAKGCQIRTTNVSDGDYSFDEEIEKYQWADFVFYQSPTFSMVSKRAKWIHWLALLLVL